MSLHADASDVLSRWQAPDRDQERLRQLYIGHLAAHDDAVWRECRPDHLTSSAIIMATDGSATVLTHHRKAQLWLQTGGHCEPGDATLADAALREAVEESGIAALDIDPEPLRLSRHEVPFCGDIQPAHHLDVQFLVRADAAAEPIASEESNAVAWWPSEALPTQTDDEVRRLIDAARQRLRGIPAP